MRDDGRAVGDLGRAFDRRRALQALAAGLGFGLGLGCGCGARLGTKGPPRTVVVYTALDREFSEPILEQYARASGVAVRPKFDVESTKTVGLTNLIVEEAERPRCDLFWNNEILNTLRLEKKGLLQPFQPANAASYPEVFKSANQTWYGFAARARILLVNTERVPESSRPTSILDLADPRWKGMTAIAKPLFGTTATHAACLFAAWGVERARGYFQRLQTNGARVVSGNKQVAQAVGAGEAAFGLTDTDDAMGEIDAGRPVAIVYPDRAGDGLGTLFIPNTLAVIKNAAHAPEAEALAGFLLAPAVEIALARGPSAQVPLNPAVTEPARVETPRTVRPMAADWAAAADLWDEAAAFLAGEFAG